MRALFGRLFIKITAMIALILLSTIVNAAEIRGRIWSENNANAAPPGAVLTVECGSNTREEIPLTRDGSYSVRGLPANGSCAATIHVTVGGRTISSDSLAVRTNATVVNFNAEVIIANNDIVIMLPR
ncbi:MAG: hypothetical protein HKN34_01345 [Gammaproteobacteria bacterium]|nr:hypothetical protein [Gammaproteobacteria bacterium]